MLILINGPLGIGKSELSWTLLDRLERGVMLDGDYIGAVRPFDLYDPDRIEYLYQTCRYLIAYHVQHGYRDFVLNYVFEEPESLDRLLDLVKDMVGQIHVFRLTCSFAEAERRIRSRSSEADRVAWELFRYRELVEIQEKAAEKGFLGRPIDTTNLTPSQLADMVLKLAGV